MDGKGIFYFKFKTVESEGASFLNLVQIGAMLEESENAGRKDMTGR